MILTEGCVLLRNHEHRGDGTRVVFVDDSAVFQARFQNHHDIVGTQVWDGVKVDCLHRRTPLLEVHLDESRRTRKRVLLRHQDCASVAHTRRHVSAAQRTRCVQAKC